MKDSLLSYDSFKEIFPGMEFAKLVTEDDSQKYNVKLKDGLNEIPLKQNYGFIDGGINFFDKDNFLEALKKSYNCKYLRKVELPDESNIFIDDKEYIADKVILGEKILIEDLKEWDNNEFCERALKIDAKFMKYIKTITPETQLNMILKDPNAIEIIRNPTEEMQLIAVKYSSWLVQKIDNPTTKVILLATENYPYVLRYIKNIPEDAIYELIGKKPELIEYFTELSEEIYCGILKDNGQLLKFVTKQTQTICDIAFINTKEAFRYVKKQFKTFDMCFEAVKFNGLFLDLVPDIHFLTELCVEAIKQNATAIEYLKIPSDEMFLLAAKQKPHYYARVNDKSLINDSNDDIILNVTPDYIQYVKNPTYEQCLKVIKRSGKLMKHIPIEHHTEELCMIAIRDFPEAVEFIDSKLETVIMVAVTQKGVVINLVKNKTHDLMMASVENNGLALEHIEDQTYNIIKTALNQNIRAFKFVKNKTTEISKFAISKDPELLIYIVDPFADTLDEEVVFEALKLKGMLLRHIPVKLITVKMCEIALNNDADAMIHVPDEFKTEDLVLPCLEKNGFVIRHIKNPTDKMNFCAVKCRPRSIQYIKNQTDKLSMFAFNLDNSILYSLSNQTPEICMAAVQKNHLAMVDVKNQELTLCMHCTILNPKSTVYIKNQDIKKQCESILAEIKTYV